MVYKYRLYIEWYPSVLTASRMTDAVVKRRRA
jgi:hypothetical protein